MKKGKKGKKGLRLSLVEGNNPDVSIVNQCRLPDVSRSAVYYQPHKDLWEDLSLMRLIDEQYLKTLFYGSRRMCTFLWGLGYKINRKRVRPLMGQMGLEAIYPKPRTSLPGQGHKVYPYLLKGLHISRPNQVWATEALAAQHIHFHGRFDDININLHKPASTCQRFRYSAMTSDRGTFLHPVKG